MIVYHIMIKHMIFQGKGNAYKPEYFLKSSEKSCISERKAELYTKIWHLPLS